MKDCDFKCEYVGCRCNKDNQCTEPKHFCPVFEQCWACVNEGCEKKNPPPQRELR